MMETECEVDVVGRTFRVIVKEGDGERTVKVIDKQQYEQLGHSYMVKSDTKEAQESGLLQEKKELPPRRQHIGNVLSEAIGKWLRVESNQQSFERDVETTCESIKQLWNEQFDTADDYEQDSV